MCCQHLVHFQADSSTMGFHQVVGDAQSQSHSLFEAPSLIAAIKRLEYFLPLVKRHPISTITNSDQYLRPFHHGVDRDLPPEFVYLMALLTRFSTAEANRKGSADITGRSVGMSACHTRCLSWAASCQGRSTLDSQSLNATCWYSSSRVPNT